MKSHFRGSGGGGTSVWIAADRNSNMTLSVIWFLIVQYLICNVTSNGAKPYKFHLLKSTSAYVLNAISLKNKKTPAFSKSCTFDKEWAAESI